MANTFPTTLNDWDSGEVIESAWADALEAKIGVDNSTVATSLDYLIKNTSSKLGKIASLAVTDGNIIVGNGTNWVAESGATARTSLSAQAKINVDAKLDYNAVGNGVADDTTALQNAINAVDAAGGGVVNIPKGTYLFTALTLKSYVILEGDGAKSTILQYTPATGNGITLAAETNNAQIIRIKIYSPNNSTGYAIYNASGTTREFVLDEYEVEGFKGGLSFASPMNCRIGIGRIIGQGRTVTGGKGIYFPNGNSVFFFQPYVSNFEQGFDLNGEGYTMNNPIAEGCENGYKTQGWITIISPIADVNGLAFQATDNSATVFSPTTRNLAGVLQNPFSVSDPIPEYMFGSGVNAGFRNNIEITKSGSVNHAEIDLINYNATYSTYFAGKRSRGTQASPTIVADGDTLVFFAAKGYDGANFQTGAYFTVEVDGTPGAGDMPGRFVFYTTPDGSTVAAEAMRINSAGATTCTSSSFPVTRIKRTSTITTGIRGTASFYHKTTADMTDNFGVGAVFEIEDSAAVTQTIASIYALRDSADNEGTLVFYAGTDGADEVLRINYAGLATFTGNVNSTGSYQIDGVQVVSNRVIDARCDDIINSGDATTDGVIDSLRDAMIAHGLIAAA